jgi:hypothetical protein
MVKLNESIYEQYSKIHNIDDLITICNIILKKDNSYFDIISKLNNINFLFTNASFVTSKDIFKEYCDFLFEVIDIFLKEKNINNVSDAFEYAKKIVEKHSNDDLSDTEKSLTTNIYYQARIVGYLQERIFTIYVLKKFNINDIIILPYKKIKETYVLDKLI